MRFQAVSKTHYFIKFDVLYVVLPHKLSNPRHKQDQKDLSNLPSYRVINC